MRASVWGLLGAGFGFGPFTNIFTSSRGPGRRTRLFTRLMLRLIGRRAVGVIALTLVRSQASLRSLTLESKRSLLRFASPVNNAVSFSLALLGVTLLALAKPVEVHHVGHDGVAL